MRNSLSVACYLVFLSFCSLHSDAEEPDSQSVVNDSRDANGVAFFSEPEHASYGVYLRAMNEPSLQSSEGGNLGNEFRFFCLPTFSKPICFRAFKQGDTCRIRVVRLTGRGGYEPGAVEIDALIEIRDGEWKNLESHVLNCVKEFELTNGQDALSSGLDGTRWILEARVEGSYWMGTVWEPDYWVSDEGIEQAKEVFGNDERPILMIDQFWKACVQFLTLTDFKVPERIESEADPGKG
ncbi:MAG: hypothetical protein Q7Q71_15390 [Verrucomicrobiota bacterium JB023]|nr:hypothetical protein [Verrucomicrobiota bacterium JB023]